MTVAGFRKIALSMPQATESAHMAHPDFRVGGKIFATLLTRDGTAFGTLKLTPDQQRKLVMECSEAFEPATGAWGRRGYTLVRLASAKTAAVRQAMFAAWVNTAPKRLVETTRTR